MWGESMKAAILQMEGTNCEEETYIALMESGFTPEYVHLNHLRKGKAKLDDYELIFIPGGFSAGDYVRAGAIFAARLKATVWKDLVKFVEEGKFIIGVCNGFQVLIELGLLPATDGISEAPEAALMPNDSGHFECRWVYLKNHSSKIFTDVPEMITLPVAHAEGKFYAPESVIEKIEAQKQVIFRYTSPYGSTEYPWNPNGSVNDIAAIMNPYGNVIGMMPHPERAYFPYQHPDWTRNKRDTGDGYYIFRALAEALR